jgi:hypothetical protein
MGNQIVSRLFGEDLKILHGTGVGRGDPQNLPGLHIGQGPLRFQNRQRAVEASCVKILIEFHSNHSAPATRQCINTGIVYSRFALLIQWSGRPDRRPGRLYTHFAPWYRRTTCSASAKKSHLSTSKPAMQDPATAPRWSPSCLPPDAKTARHAQHIEDASFALHDAEASVGSQTRCFDLPISTANSSTLAARFPYAPIE